MASSKRRPAIATGTHGVAIGTQFNIGPGATIHATDADGTTLIHTTDAPALDDETTVEVEVIRGELDD